MPSTETKVSTATPQQLAPRGVIPGLNALRAFAIVLVLAYHLSIALHFRLKPSGPLGVMIFFVLSGYLITGLLLSEYRKTGGISLRRFYARRAFRLLPAFYVCWFIVTVALVHHRIPIDKKEALGSFFYMTNYIRAFSSNPQEVHMGISWSLAIEEQFYLLWPALLIWLLRSGKDLKLTLIWIIGALWLIRSVAYLTGGADANYLYNAFEMRADALLIGSLLAVTKGQASRIQSAVTRSPWCAGLTGCIVLAMALGEQSWYQYMSRISFVTFISMQPVIIGILLINLVRWAGLLLKWIDHPVIAFVATISYTLYLYHLIAIDEAFRLGIFAHNHKLGFCLLLLVFTLSSYYLIEQPMLRLRDRVCP